MRVCVFFWENYVGNGKHYVLDYFSLIPGCDERERQYDRDPECDEGWYDGGGGGAVPSRVLVGDYADGAYIGGG